MGALGVLLFLAIGIGAAKLFDDLFLKTNNAVGGKVKYEPIEKMDSFRSVDRDCDRHDNVDQPGNGGDVCRVLQVRTRK